MEDAIVPQDIQYMDAQLFQSICRENNNEMLNKILSDKLKFSNFDNSWGIAILICYYERYELVDYLANKVHLDWLIILKSSCFAGLNYKKYQYIISHIDTIPFYEIDDVLLCAKNVNKSEITNDLMRFK